MLFVEYKRVNKVNILKSTTAKDMLSNDDIVLIDIRSGAEYDAEHIDGALNISVDHLDKFDFSNKEVIFYCFSGMRTKNNASALSQLKAKNHYIIDGGITEWKKSGYPTIRKISASLPLMQQVQILISLVLFISLILTYAISPWFLLITLFVSCGLLFAGLTGYCGMAVFLSKMPWNKANKK